MTRVSTIYIDGGFKPCVRETENGEALQAYGTVRAAEIDAPIWAARLRTESERRRQR